MPAASKPRSCSCKAVNSASTAPRELQGDPKLQKGCRLANTLVPASRDSELNSTAPRILACRNREIIDGRHFQPLGLWSFVTQRRKLAQGQLLSQNTLVQGPRVEVTVTPPTSKNCVSSSCSSGLFWCRHFGPWKRNSPMGNPDNSPTDLKVQASGSSHPWAGEVGRLVLSGKVCPDHQGKTRSP